MGGLFTRCGPAAGENKARVASLKNQWEKLKTEKRALTELSKKNEEALTEALKKKEEALTEALEKKEALTEALKKREEALTKALKKTEEALAEALKKEVTLTEALVKEKEALEKEETLTEALMKEKEALEVPSGRVYGFVEFRISTFPIVYSSYMYTPTDGLQVVATVNYDGQDVAVTPRLHVDDSIASVHNTPSTIIRLVTDGRPDPTSWRLPQRCLVKHGEDSTVTIRLATSMVGARIHGLTGDGFTVYSVVDSPDIYTHSDGLRVKVIVSYDARNQVLTATPHLYVGDPIVAEYSGWTLFTTTTVSNHHLPTDHPDHSSVGKSQATIDQLVSNGGILNTNSWGLSLEHLERIREDDPITICFVATVASTREHGRTKFEISESSIWPVKSPDMYTHTDGPRVRAEATLAGQALRVKIRLLDDPSHSAWAALTLHSTITVDIPGSTKPKTQKKRFKIRKYGNREYDNSMSLNLPQLPQHLKKAGKCDPIKIWFVASASHPPHRWGCYGYWKRQH